MYGVWLVPQKGALCVGVGGGGEGEETGCAAAAAALGDWCGRAGPEDTDIW